MPNASSRVTAVLVLSFLGTTMAATPAGAHGSGQGTADAAYYRTELTDVTPTMAGVSASVDPGGEWVGLTNTGSAVVIVLGYSREPYLRITANSTEENQRSQTAVINRALFTDSLPSGDAATMEPEWKQTATVGAVRWHDHRIHWMGQSRPPDVAADPKHPHLVGSWTVRATADGAPFELHGTLNWLGKPDTLAVSPWLVAMLIPLLVLILVAGWHILQQRRHSRGSDADVVGSSTP